MGVLEVVLKQRLKINYEKDIILDFFPINIGIDQSSENILALLTEFLVDALMFKNI